ncbi:MAG: hypothetical protein AAF577_05870 [Pseudomonadota bacterium]
MTEGQTRPSGFLRFVVVNTRLDLSDAREGIFQAAYALRDGPDADSVTHAQLVELLTWFDRHLPVPERVNRSRSKGAWRRETAGIAWFRDSAAPVIERAFDLVEILRRHGMTVEILRTRRPGYIVYEDDLQVITEPFADTPR